MIVFTRVTTDEPSEQLLLDEQAAVTCDLHRVLAREGMRGAEDGAEDLVQYLFFPLNTAEMDGIRLCGGQRCTTDKQAVHNRDSLLARDADDGYAAYSVGR